MKYPTYSVSTGVTEVEPGEDPGSVFQRLELSVSSATETGGNNIFVNDSIYRDNKQHSECLPEPL
ncbi:MAG: hypothetical protein CMJ72_11840 [Planctomycetaceae bacterium]|nr:hypothetical protein [Planctomycetaceae bacterium]MCH2595292.1 hypothetical protein [Pirellulales bacterium]